MNLETKHIIECHINLINSLCQDLDFLTSENIETEGGCSLDCCIGNRIIRDTKTLIESNLSLPIIGEIGLIFLHQLIQDFKWVLHCCEKDFSKTQRWLAFVDYARKGNDHLKQSIKKCTSL